MSTNRTYFSFSTSGHCTVLGYAYRESTPPCKTPVESALQFVVVEQDEHTQENHKPVACLVGQNNVLELLQDGKAQWLQDSLREDGGHLVVDERRYLDDGISLVTVGEALGAESVPSSAPPAALEESACHPKTYHVG